MADLRLARLRAHLVPQRTGASAVRRKRVAVLGGSFDPITYGHLTMCAEVINALFADEVWLVPCGPRANKPSLRTPAHERCVMCHLAVNTVFGARYPVKVVDLETRLPAALPTYELLRQLKAAAPGNDYLFVVGTDLVGGLRGWENGEKLVAENDFIVISRPGYEIEGPLPPNCMLLQAPGGPAGSTVVADNLSSSEVRKRLATRTTARTFSNGDAERTVIQQGDFSRAEGLVPAAVLAHIVRYELYSIPDVHAASQRADRLPFKK